jgi:hypothetical protein
LKSFKPLWDRTSDEHADLVDMYHSGKLQPNSRYQAIVTLHPEFAKDYDNQSFRNAVKDVKKEFNDSRKKKKDYDVTNEKKIVYRVSVYIDNVFFSFIDSNC